MNSAIVKPVVDLVAVEAGKLMEKQYGADWRKRALTPEGVEAIKRAIADATKSVRIALDEMAKRGGRTND